MGRVGAPLHSGDVLGFSVSGDGELTMSRNGASAGARLCVDNSRPLWMFYGLHGNITQLRILGEDLFALGFFALCVSVVVALLVALCVSLVNAHSLSPDLVNSLSV